MSRIANTILTNKGTYAEQRVNDKIVDPRYGGQFGHMSDVSTYINHTPYVRKNVIAVMIEAPRGFKDLNDGGRMTAAVKALFENASKTIEGLNQTLEPDFVQTDFGGSGEQQEVISDMKRTRSEPVHGLTERYGRPWASLINFWQTTFGMDPVTKIPNIITMGVRPKDMLPDYTSATVLYFEPDPTFTKVDKAWLCTNMFPKTGVPVEGRRDLVSAGELVDFTVSFTCIQQISLGVERLAQTILEAMVLNGSNPNLQPAFVEKIHADVGAEKNGYIDQLDTMVSKRVRV